MDPMKAFFSQLLSVGVPVVTAEGNSASLETETRAVDVSTLAHARRLGVTVEQYEARLAKWLADDLAAMKANPILPADDEEHYEPKRLACNTGERRQWED